MEPRFYEGDAAVHADGAVYPCWANLRCWADQVRARTFGGTTVHDGQQQWTGRLRFRGADAETVLFASSVRLVVDGAEGRFLIDTRDPAGGTLEIRGTGPAPF
ncbi:hypothetical protein [Kitasatospora sp. NPDC059571]|uniref:hypothetical protein n=1 Tax=Kitasatospora sp. NPDC059571 TaxID=3346871 RepID=UPI0036C0CE59